MDEILIARKKGNQLKLKVCKRKRNQYSDPIYRKVLNPREANDLALFLGDLKIHFNSPIDMAYKILKKEEEGLGNGFWLYGAKD
ncbi:hypothetical protein LCGC14_3087900 [marine sediment metagenome]|uniref:Uncharacterized protein n=1 Tax=marine sediment metagenome TaxID=412755 RepID=A0A0F8WBZ7_9ZZZZ